MACSPAVWGGGGTRWGEHEPRWRPPAGLPSHTAGSSEVPRPPTAQRGQLRAARPPCPGRGLSRLTSEGWSPPGFYGRGLVFPATVSRTGGSPEDAEWPQRLAVLPCAWSGGREPPEEAREPGGRCGKVPRERER